MSKLKQLSYSMAGPKEINQPIKPIEALRTERDKLSGMITRREQTIADAGVTGAIRIGQPWEHKGRGGDALSATLKVGRARKAARRSVERMSGDLEQLDAEITGYDRARDYETHVQQLQTRLGEAAELVAEGVLAQEDIAGPNKEYETLLNLPSKDPYLARGLERLRRKREAPDADRTITDRRTEDKPASKKSAEREERGPVHVHPTRASALTLFLGEDTVTTDEIITALGPTRGKRPQPLNKAQAADALRNALNTIARRVADGTATPEESELYKLRETYMERQGITTVGDLTHHIRTRLGVNTAGYQKRRQQDGTPSPNLEQAPGAQGLANRGLITEVVAELIEVRRGTVARPVGGRVLVTTATAGEQAGQSEVARVEPQEKPPLELPNGRELTDEQFTLLYVLYQGYGKDQLSTLALGNKVQQIVWRDEELLDDTLRRRITRLIRGTEEQEGLNKILEGTGWEIIIKSGATGGPYLEYKEPTPEIPAPPAEVNPQVAAVTRAHEAVIDTPQFTDRDASEREKPALELPELTDNERLLVEKLYEAYGVQNLSMTTLAKTLWEETLPVGTASTRIHRLLAGLHSKLEGTGWEITSLRGRHGGLTLRYEAPPLTTDALLGATGVEAITPTQDRSFDLKAAMEEAIRGPQEEIAEATGAALARAVEGVTAQGKEGTLLNLLLGSSIFDVRTREMLAASLWPDEKRSKGERHRLSSMVSRLKEKLKQRGVTIDLRHELVLGRTTREDGLDVQYGYFLAPDKEVGHLPVRTMEDVIAEVDPVGEYGTLNKANIAMIAGALDRFQGKINPLLSALGLPELTLDLIDQLETINDDASIPGRDKVQAGDLSKFINAYRAHSLQKAIDLINADDFADQWNVINEHHAGVGELLTVLANLRAVKGRVNGNSEINGLEYVHELMQDPELSVDVTYIATEVPLGDATLPLSGNIVVLSQSPIAVATGVESYDTTLDIPKDGATPRTEAKARSTFAKLLTRDPEAITTMEEYFAAIVAKAPNVLQGRRLAEVTVREMFPQLADFPFGKNGIKRAIGRELRPGKQGIYDLSAEGIAAALYLHESIQLPRDIMRQILPLAEYAYKNYLTANESGATSIPPKRDIVVLNGITADNGEERDPFHRILDRDPIARERMQAYFNDLGERRNEVLAGEHMSIETVKVLFPKLNRFAFVDNVRNNTVPSYVNTATGGYSFDEVGVAVMLYITDTRGNLPASIKKQLKRLAKAEYDKWVATKEEQQGNGNN